MLCFKFLSSLRNHRVPLSRLSAYNQGYWSRPLPSALTNSHFWLQSSVRGDNHLCEKCPGWTGSFSCNAESFVQMTETVMLVWEWASWARFVIPGSGRQQARHRIPLSPGKHQRPVFSSLGVSQWLVSNSPVLSSLAFGHSHLEFSCLLWRVSVTPPSHPCRWHGRTGADSSCATAAPQLYSPLLGACSSAQLLKTNNNSGQRALFSVLHLGQTVTIETISPKKFCLTKFIHVAYSQHLKLGS